MTPTPDMGGCWRCCTCSAEVNSVLYGIICQDCSHNSCNYCYRYPKGKLSWRDRDVLGGGEASGSITSVTAPSPSTLFDDILSTLLYSRAFRRRLPILLNEVSTQDACADSGSEVNCITKAYAAKIGSRIAQQPWRARSKSFSLPLKGSKVSSIGRALINCRFPRAPFMPRKCEFFVFESLICDVILGRQFLRDTKTLEYHQERFDDIKRGLKDMAIVRSVGRVREHVYCWLNETPMWALPDTGAQVNLISSEFARDLGYGDETVGRLINRNDCIWLEFADCSSIQTLGSVNITISFSDPGKSKSPVCRLVESQSGSKGKSESGKIGPNYKFSETFYVVRDLRQDVILGETLLSTVDAFNQHAGNFRASYEAAACISIGRKKTKREGKGNPKPPPCEEEQFQDEFAREYDRVQLEMKRIEDQFRALEISEHMARFQQQQVHETHVEWIRINKELLDRYSPGYYNENVPGELG